MSISETEGMVVHWSAGKELVHVISFLLQMGFKEVGVHFPLASLDPCRLTLLPFMSQLGFKQVQHLAEIQPPSYRGCAAHDVVSVCRQRAGACDQFPASNGLQGGGCTFSIGKPGPLTGQHCCPHVSAGPASAFQVRSCPFKSSIAP